MRSYKKNLLGFEAFADQATDHYFFFDHDARNVTACLKSIHKIHDGEG